MPSTEDVSRKVAPWIKGLVVFGIAGTVLTLLIGIPGLLVTSRASNDRNAWATLRTIASAQEDFRANDRDGNGRRDYWRKDIAGLYALSLPGAPDPIRLIELSCAGADAAPQSPILSYTVQSPKAGYLYRALFFVGEDAAKPDPDRYAAQAYPASPAAGRVMFIVSQDGVVWRKAAVAGGIYVFPASPELEGWTRAP